MVQVDLRKRRRIGGFSEAFACSAGPKNAGSAPCHFINGLLEQVTDNTYDLLQYPLRTHRDSHPRELEFVATLFGMKPCDITNSRVLELGCAAGTNLLPMAVDCR